MIVDSFTKALPQQQHKEFLRQIRLKNITDCIQQKKKIKTLRDQIKDFRAHKSASMLTETVFLVQRDRSMRELDERSLYINL